MGSSSKLLMFLALATLVQVCVSQNSGDEACVTQLMPCQPDLKTTTPPSAECCLNLKKEILNDPLCLCRVLTDAALLKSFNVTQAEALNLPKRCGAQADVSLCKNAPIAPGLPANTPPAKGSPPSPSSGNYVGKSSSSIVVLLAFIWISLMSLVL